MQVTRADFLSIYLMEATEMLTKGFLFGALAKNPAVSARKSMSMLF
jgi:hypothetical protein